MSKASRLYRAKRIQQKQRGIRRQVKIAASHGMDTSEPHRFAKMSALNCGIPNCPMCGNPRHSGFHKTDSKLTMQERKQLQDRLDDIEVYDEYE